MLSGPIRSDTRPPSIAAPLVGGLAAIALSIVLRSLFETRLLAEIVLDASTQGLRPGGFSFFLQLLEGMGKPLLFLSVVLTELIVYGAAWRIAGRLADPERAIQRELLAAGLAMVPFLGVSGAMLALSDAELGSDTSLFEYVAVCLITSLTFAVLAGLTEEAGEDEREDARYSGRRSRREVLGLFWNLGVGGIATLIIGRQFLKSTGGGAMVETSGKLTPEVTSNDGFYIVSKNLIDPTVSERSWRLKVGGSTETMLELTYVDLLARTEVEQYTTMQCVSNAVGGNLMSTALWTGVRLRDVIRDAGALPSAKYVGFRSEDDYEETLPLDFAMGDGVLLAYLMNGEPLPDKHGFPLRLLAPGKYGIKHPKWITEIQLMDEESFGYWQKRYWTQEARMNTSCRIDVPAPGSLQTSGDFRVHGVAFSGDRGISRVEVSVDGRKTWREAVLKPALSPYIWVLWHYDWSPGASGMIEIAARATDGRGEVQTAVDAPPHPNGATGYPRRFVRLGS